MFTLKPVTICNEKRYQILLGTKVRGSLVPMSGLTGRYWSARIRFCGQYIESNAPTIDAVLLKLSDKMLDD